MAFDAGKIDAMKENVLSSSGGAYKSLLIFILSMAVYLFYFAGAYPGLFSRDVQLALFTLLDSGEYFKFIIPIDLQFSFFYNLYILIFYSISRNLVALGLFQAALASALNVYCWNALSKYSKEKIAWTVVLLMIFSPLNGIETAWYHRSSLLAYLIFANLVWLYRFSKGCEFKKFESILFFANLLVIANLRIDGIIISLASACIYILKGKKGATFRVAFLALLMFSAAINFFIVKSSDKFYLILPFVFSVQRVHQESGAEFRANDIKVLRSVSPSESARRVWLKGDDQIDDLRNIFDDEVKPSDANNFVRWSALFLTKNASLFLKTQTEIFFNSSLLKRKFQSFYLYRDNEYRGDEVYAKINEKVDIAHKPYMDLPNRIADFIYLNSYSASGVIPSDPGYFLYTLFFGTFVPFIFIFLYFVMALMRNRAALIPLIPLILYGIFMFLFQPRSKCYYWYWLAYANYFIVFAIGCDVFFVKKQSNRHDE